MKEIEADRKALLDRVAELRFFQVLSANERERLLEAGTVLEYEPGEEIVRQNERSSYLYAILDGTVRVLVQAPTTKREVFVCAMDEGVFGEAAIFVDMKRTAKVAADGPTQLVRLERKDLMAFMKKHPRAGIRILLFVVHSLMQKLRDVDQELAFERQAFVDQSEVDRLFKEFAPTDEKKE
ncbi:MAG: cyclic nucleotide-binding domain-containing protein [Kiritimatiellae bacterium]|nr:cyclic nucleotide-binding domain-containing protein [Kiritimatiellia bacterium]